MKTKVIDYSSTNDHTKNILEADGFQIKNGIPFGATGGSNLDTKVISYASTQKGEINIIEADGFSIKGVGMLGDGFSSIEKHPYVGKQKVTNDMTDAQKQGISIWNSLVSKIVEAGLMEDKK